MIRPKFREKNIESHEFGSLGGQFLDKASINMARPIKPRLIVQFAAHQCSDTFITDEHHSQVLGVSSRIFLSFPYAPIICHPFKALKEVKTRKMPGDLLQQTDQGNGGSADQEGDELFRFDPHRRRKRKTPSATCRCSGRENSNGRLSARIVVRVAGVGRLARSGEIKGSLNGTPGGGPGGVNGRPN